MIGFGERGVDGMIKVCRYARENLIPYFGICLGLQIAVIEFCRNVLNIPDANSKEFDKNTPNDVITTMDDVSYEQFGGTLRKGAKPTHIKCKDSLAYKIYGSQDIVERHRHRYEVNPTFISKMEENGMIFSGKDPDSERMSILEIPSHPFFFATQYHPEFKTNPFEPTPIFYTFTLAASKQYDKLRKYCETHVPGIKYVIESQEELKSADPTFIPIFETILTDEKMLKDSIKKTEENNSIKNQKKLVINSECAISTNLKEVEKNNSSSKDVIKQNVGKMSSSVTDQNIILDEKTKIQTSSFNEDY
jgi:hypothetical protein